MNALARTPDNSHVAVIGGGTMGADVAATFARGGCRVIVVERHAEKREGLAQRVREALAIFGCAQRADSVHAVANADDLPWRDLDLVVECIPERLTEKQALFAELERKAAAHTVLTSNSSSFPISRIGQDLPGAERRFGLHFFMPAHLVPLVEVVMGPRSDPSVAARLCDFMRACGSVPVLVRKDRPGFLANRLQHALAREAFALIEDGVASPEDVDAAVRFGFGFRFLAAGPILQREHGGLDVHCAAAATIYPSLSNATEPSRVLREQVALGRTGIKAGAGFSEWPEAARRAERERYDRLLRRGLALLAEELGTPGPRDAQ